MPPSPADTPDPRVVRTRRLIEDAMLSFVSERPYTAVTVKDIAARATVNRATFYAHFADKDDLLRGILRGRLDRALSERLDGGDDEPVAFASYLDALLPAALEYSDWSAGGCRSARGNGLDAAIPEAELQARVETLVGRWLAVGEDGSADVVARAVGAMVARVATDWSRRAERVPGKEVIAQLRALVLGAVGAMSDDVPAVRPALARR